MKRLQIAGRIKQSIQVIESQPDDFPFANQTQDEFVGGREEGRLLHAHADQVIDIEEASVIDLVRGGSPIREAIGKGLQQLVKAVKSARLARLAIDGSQRVLDIFLDARRPGCDLAEALAGHFLFPLPLGLAIRIRLAEAWQMLERGQNAQKFRKVGVACPLPDGRGSDLLGGRGSDLLRGRGADLERA